MEALNKIPVNNEVAEIQLTYKRPLPYRKLPVVTSSREAFAILKNCWDENILELQEQFKVLLLDRASRVLGIYEASTGGMTGTVVDLKLIFAAAIKAGASAIILCHNHPSQSLKPSSADKEITEKIKSAGKLLEITLADHLIITCESYYSFAEEGLI